MLHLERGTPAGCVRRAVLLQLQPPHVKLTIGEVHLTGSTIHWQCMSNSSEMRQNRGVVAAVPGDAVADLNLEN